MDTSNVKVGFIGAGNMAYAIGKALVSSGVVKAENIIASARTRTRLDTCWKVYITSLFAGQHYRQIQLSNIFFGFFRPNANISQKVKILFEKSFFVLIVHPLSKR